MNLLATPSGRRGLFALLYFTEGAPIGFLWWALPTLMRAEGVPLEQITSLLALLVLPWTFKFLWAPLVDTLRGPRFGLRSWIVACQLLMALALIPLLGSVGDGVGYTTVVLCLMLHAFAAATQDAAIDALAIQSAPASERGTLNGWMQAGMLAGRAVFGGGALLLREPFGDRAVVLLLIVVLLSTPALALLYREMPGRGAELRFSSFVSRLREALRSPTTWSGLWFAAVAGAGFEIVGSLAGPYLVDRNVNPAETGRFFAMPAVACMVLGALLGGRLADHGRRRRVVLAMHLSLSLSIFALAAYRTDSLSFGPFLPLALVYFAIGLFTAASYALFMDVTDPRIGATQFSTFMGATNLCEAWATWLGGRVAAASGYPAAFVMMALLSTLALPALLGMRRAASR